MRVAREPGGGHKAAGDLQLHSECDHHNRTLVYLGCSEERRDGSTRIPRGQAKRKDTALRLPEPTRKSVAGRRQQPKEQELRADREATDGSPSPW
ncbi:MAG: hypothetical protein NTX90_04620 [Alphaproteobacteria bacterium]|nr:hypothetical protein [Alphaproteobacteria bacterium]